MKPFRQDKRPGPPLSVKAIRDGSRSTTDNSVTPAVLLPTPRKAAAKPDPSTLMAQGMHLMLPVTSEPWAASSSGTLTFSSSATVIEMPASTTDQLLLAKPVQRKRRLRPKDESFLTRQVTVRPTQIEGDHISFACPACNHGLSLPLLQAGKKARCPQCSSAIRAPRLHSAGKSHSYEGSVEALLHPEHFQAPRNGPRRFLGMPRPKLLPMMLGSAAAIVALCGTKLIHLNETVTPVNQRAQIISLNTKLEHDVFDPVADAETLVKAFLQADSWQTKARFVRDPLRVGKLMEQFYAREQGKNSISPVTVSASAPTYYYHTEQLKHRHCVVETEMPDGKTSHFTVEFLPEGPRIEWESSVAYAPVSWNKMVVTAQPNTPCLQRVSACLDDYYNYEFNDRSKYISLYLQDPNTGASLGNGYVLRDSPAASEVLTVLGNNNRQNLKRIMIEVQPQPTSAKHRLIEITRFVKSGFRNPPASAVASIR